MRRQSGLKRVVKLGISLAAGATLWVVRGGRRVLRLQGTPPCVALYYHAVGDDDRARFAAQMDVLQRLTTPVPADRCEPLPGRGPHSVVTFDDGFESVLRNALPELASRKIPCTIFLISSRFRSPDTGGKAAGYAGRERFIAPAQARALDAGLVLIGSHTITHPLLPALPEEDAAREIVESKREIEETLGRPVALFSFPYGGFNERLVERCRAAGYARVFTTLPHLALRRADEYVTGRISVEPSDWPIEFRLKLLGAYQWLPLAFALKRRLKRLLRMS